MRILRALIAFGVCVLAGLLFSAELCGGVAPSTIRPPAILKNQRGTKHFYIYSDLDLDMLDKHVHFFEGFFEYFDK